ncbi:hypothetical protein CXB51_007232 [Gossypium anomalum]|uniref:Retrotransposon Copia-like N-terminal domain-containing protein n=1 Tax=Gossypium anomalum TaxID=47600 RepID=A0A8J5ZVM9_9ROSI|nr:hypothetical protein CXB51_007232 [Gossypium anomalum]
MVLIDSSPQDASLVLVADGSRSTMVNNAGAATFLSTKKIALLVDESNYLAWRQHVLLILKTHRLQLYIKGTITIPPCIVKVAAGKQMKNPTYIAFEQQDSALASWLMSSSRTNKMLFRCKLHNVKKLNKSMTEYLAEIKHICDTLSSCGQVITEEHQSTILNGLPPEYENIVSIIISSQQEYDLAGVTYALLDAEARQLMISSLINVSANVVQQKSTTDSKHQSNSSSVYDPESNGSDRSDSVSQGYYSQHIINKGIKLVLDLEAEGDLVMVDHSANCVEQVLLQGHTSWEETEQPKQSEAQPVFFLSL